jgi:cysteine synthase
VDILVAGVACGGTITGVAEYFKPLKQSIRVGSRAIQLSCAERREAQPTQDSGYRRRLRPRCPEDGLVDEVTESKMRTQWRHLRQLARKEASSRISSGGGDIRST